MPPLPAPRTHALTVTRRLLSPLAALGSVLLLATCDLDKITATKTPGTNPTGLTFSVSGTDQVILAGTTTLGITPTLNNVAVRWRSTAPTVATVDSLTGVVTGVSIGSASIIARVLGMELDTGFTQTKAMTVRYKGIRIVAMDSITGLGHTRTATVNGLNNADVVQVGALSATLTIHDSGSANATIASLTSGVVKGLKNGVAYLKATFAPDLSDSVKVRVRQVAKNITFADTVYTSNALLFNRTIPVTVRDVADSIIGTPVLRWRSSDTNKVAIDSMTGVLRVKVRDTARVTVRMDTVIRTIKVRLIQQVGTLGKTQGDLQTDTIAQLLSVAPRVTALDSGGVAVPNATVTFRVGSGGGVITDSVQTTDASGVATLGSWTLGTLAGAQTVIASTGTISSTFTATATAAAAQKLVFTVHPASAAVGAAIAPSIRVAIQDSAGNVVTSANNSITLSFNTNPNPGAVLGGTLTRAAVNGVATFDNITVSAGGSGFVLLGVATGLTSAVSNSFDAYGAATKLGFVAQPVGTSAGGVMQAVQVAVQDANGATVTTATDNVTLSLGNPGTATLGGTRTVAAVNGIATFSDLSVSVAGSGYTLLAAATGRTGATSSTFTVAAVGTAARLAFSVQPSNAVSGAAIAPAVKVQVLDANNAVVLGSTQQIVLSEASGAAVTGGTTANAVNGEATFTNVTIGRAGTGYRLVASASGVSTITSGTSTTFNVTPAAATKLAFVQNPTHVVSGSAIAPSVTVAVQDASSNTVTTHPATPVALTINGTGCTAANVSGLGATNTSSGVATFAAITPSATFSSCTLTASASGLTSGTSSAFNSVAASGAVKLAFTTEPASVATAGVAMNAGTVSFHSATGSTATPGTATFITISVLSGPGTIVSGSTQSANTTTSASFSNIVFNKAGAYRLLATATGYKPDTSAEFTVSAAAADRIGFITQPNNIVAGVPFDSTIRVAIQDQFSNTVSGVSATITLSASLAETPFTSLRFNNGQFQMSLATVNGVASFPGTSVRGAGALIRLHANSPAAGASSQVFRVTPGPLSALGFVRQPSSNQTAGVVLTNAANGGAIEVQGQDSVGNVITSFANPITLTLVGGNPAAVLNGAKTVTPTEGLAAFSDLSINQAASGYQLSASASGVTTASSGSFTVNPGPVSKIMWIAQPQNTFANAPLNPSGQLPRVANTDQFGNIVQDGWGMTITILNPTVGMSLKDNGSNTTQYSAGPDCSTICTGYVQLPSTLTVSTHGSAIQLLATSHNTNRGTATSAAFNIGAFSAKTKVGFAKQPTNTSYGISFSDTLTVAVQDQYGNTDTTATNTVNLSLSTNPGSATLSSTSLAAVKGVAKFQPLTLDKAGTGYVISAASTGLTGAASNAFNVTLPGILSFTNYICDMTRQGNTIWFVDCNSAGSLWSVPVTGGTPVQRVIGIANPYRIASDANNVYWIEQGASAGAGAVKKFSLTTGNVTTMASGLSDVRWEANTFGIDGTNVYFMARNLAGTTTAIRSVALSVGGPTTPADVVSPGSCNGCAPWFVVGTNQIFYYDFSTDVIRRVATTGGATTALTNTGIGNTQMLALNGTTLLMSQKTNLKTIPNATTIAGPVTPSPQIDAGVNFNSWLVDGSFLYVNNNGTLVRYSLADFGSSTSLGVGALHNNAQQGFVTSATDVFAYQQNGQLVKVPK